MTSHERRRRLFLVALAVLAVPRQGSGQQRPPLVCVMLASPINGPFAAALRQGLKELGYLEGTNIRLEFRSTGGRPERFSEIAQQLINLKPDVIVAGGGGPSARAAMSLTRVIPIVVPATADPVLEGLVQSLARPGGNVTGLSIISEEINAKRMQVLTELLPKARKVGLLVDPDMGNMNSDAAVHATRRAAATLGLELVVLRARVPEEFAAVFRTARASTIDALIVAPSSTYNVHRKALVDLATEHRLIAIWEHRQFATSGGLLSYGPDIAELYRSAARSVHDILKGAKAADLPIQQATKFELVVNMKTAKAMGVTVPPPVLLRADEVIR
jgi:putative ABC transport system substrate-binding protein